MIDLRAAKESVVPAFSFRGSFATLFKSKLRSTSFVNQSLGNDASMQPADKGRLYPTDQTD